MITQLFHTPEVKKDRLSRAIITSIAPLSATNSLYTLTEDIILKSPKAASHAELESDCRRFTVRCMDP